MKHNLKITLILVAFFFVSQLVGLFILYQDLKIDTTITETGEKIINITHSETVLGPRPEVRNFDALILILISVLIGTALIFAIIKLGKAYLWKGLFFLSIFFSISISLGTFLPYYLAFAIGFTLSTLKVFRPNIYIHNITEVFIYSGIAVLFVPLFEPIWIIILLLIISGYDMFAVWKSKHMVKLAEFQISSGAFAGLSIPYKNKPKQKGKPAKSDRVENAILGGGDIAFPLLFIGVVMESLIKSGLGNFTALFESLLITIFITISLLGLLLWSKKGRYYPAMPFLTAGCLLGYGLILLI